MRGVILYSVLLVYASGCDGCGEEEGEQIDELDASVDLPQIPDACDPDTDTITLDSLKTAHAAIAAGGDLEVPFSVAGCHRFKRTGTREEIIRWTGDIDVVLDASHNVIATRREAVRGRWTTTGTQTEAELDGDEDGFYATTWTATPTRKVLTQRSPSSQAVIRRVTQDWSGATVHQKVEELVGGTLTVAAEFDASTTQRACPTPPAPGQQCTQVEEPCADSGKIRDLLLSSGATGFDCLIKRGMTDDALDVLFNVLKMDFQVKCARTNCIEAEILSGPGVPKPVVTVNIALFEEGCASAAGQKATLFHELLHLSHGSHDPAEESFVHPQALPYVDQIYACEQMCFNANATDCHCAACLKTTSCDNRCIGTVDCKYEANPDGGFPLRIGKQVGALCKDGTGNYSWFNTKADCVSGCSGGSCDSKSRSCKPTCQ
jgi:hypothetical protein